MCAFGLLSYHYDFLCFRCIARLLVFFFGGKEWCFLQRDRDWDRDRDCMCIYTGVFSFSIVEVLCRALVLVAAMTASFSDILIWFVVVRW